MKVVCATDLSETSPGVVHTAATLSGLLGAELELFHTLLIPTFPAGLTDDRLVAEMLESAEASLAAQAAASGAAARPTTHVQLGGPDAIVDRARRVQADLLVVGTHGRRGMNRVLLGSVAERTLRTSSCPVLVVPNSAPSVSFGAQARQRALKVVVGVDLSPASDAALAWLAALRDRVACDVRLVHLYVPAVEHARLGFPPPDPFESDPELVEVLARELRPHIQAATGTDFSLRIRPLWGGEEDPLAWEAETDDADLLVIGTSQARHSTALRTVRGAHVPVVCVPRNGTAAKTERLTPIRTILVPTDFSPGAAAAVSEAHRLLLATGGDVVLAHIAHPDAVGLEPTRQEDLENCLLALVPDELAGPHIRVRTLVIADAAPAEAIVKAVRRVGADLVVMAASGKNGRRGGHGMVTDHVVRNAPQPVVVVPWPPRA